jgi:hypothetical protein
MEAFMSRRSSSFRLAGWVGLLVVLTGALSVTAFALTRSDGPKPPKRPLAAAIHAALVGRPVQGVSATVKLSQDLLPGSSSLVNQSALGSATGRLWVGGGRVRLHLTSSMGAVDVAFDGRRITLLDRATHTAYVFTLPPHRASHRRASHHAVPSVAEIGRALARVGRWASLSDATPSTVAGRPAYTVRIAPRHAAGLLGAAELAWDSQHGTPLRFAIYPTGSSTPAVELAVTNIRYGGIAPAALALKLPAGTQVVPVQPPAERGVTAPTMTGGSARIRAVAPASAGGWTRTAVRPLQVHGQTGAVVVYGHGLGAVVALEQPAVAGSTGARALTRLPAASIGGAPGRVLETTLGSAVRFTRGGVTFTVAGFQPVETVERVAAGLR